MKYLFIFLVLSICIASCVKKECDIAGGYEFVAPATYTPAKDTFSIGDTISIVSKFTDDVYEKNSNKYYKLENFKFFPITSILQIDTFPALARVTSFKLLVDSNTNYKTIIYSTGKSFLVGEYAYSGGNYLLEYKLVAKQAGLFLVCHGIEPGMGGEQDFEGRCCNLVDPNGAVKMNNGSDNNVNMLSYSPDPHYSEWILNNPERRFYPFGCFCFYVKE